MHYFSDYMDIDSDIKLCEYIPLATLYLLPLSYDIRYRHRFPTVFPTKTGRAKFFLRHDRLCDFFSIDMTVCATAVCSTTYWPT